MLSVIHCMFPEYGNVHTTEGNVHNPYILKPEVIKTIWSFHTILCIYSIYNRGLEERLVTSLIVLLSLNETRKVFLKKKHSCSFILLFKTVVYPHILTCIFQ